MSESVDSIIDTMVTAEVNWVGEFYKPDAAGLRSLRHRLRKWGKANGHRFSVVQFDRVGLGENDSIRVVKLVDAVTPEPVTPEPVTPEPVTSKKRDLHQWIDALRVHIVNLSSQIADVQAVLARIEASAVVTSHQPQMQPAPTKPLMQPAPTKPLMQPIQTQPMDDAQQIMAQQPKAPVAQDGATFRFPKQDPQANLPLRKPLPNQFGQ